MLVIPRYPSSLRVHIHAGHQADEPPQPLGSSIVSVSDTSATGNPNTPQRLLKRFRPSLASSRASRACRVRASLPGLDAG